MVKRISWLLCLFLVIASGLSAAEPMPLQTIKGHTNSAEALLFSHDGKTLISGSVDRSIKFWDVSTGKPVATLQADGMIECLASFPKGDGRIASGGLASDNASSIAIWDVAHKKKVATLGKDYENLISTISIAVSPNGKTVATGSLLVDRCSTDLWDATSHKKITTLAMKAPVPSLAFSPDSTVLATAEGLEGGKNVKLWNVATGKRLAVLCGHTDAAAAVAFSPDGKLLASCSLDGTIRLWDLVVRKNTAILKVPSRVLIGVSSIAFHPDGKILASGCYRGILRLWDVTTGKLVTDFKTDAGSVLCVAFSPDGKTLASSNADNVGTIQLWDVASLMKQKVSPIKVAESPGKAEKLGFFSTAPDVPVKRPKPLRTIRGHKDLLMATAFSHDGKTLFSGGGGGLDVWNVSTGELVAALPADGFVQGLALFPKNDGMIASYSLHHNSPIELWEIAKKRKVAVILGGDDLVSAIAVSPNGNTIAAVAIGSGDDAWRIGLWDSESLKETTSLVLEDKAFAIAFSPDGAMLASGECLEKGNNVKLWDVATGKRLATLSGHREAVRSVTFSPDGKLLATGSDDGTVKLWDVATGKNKATLKRQPVPLFDVMSVAFHPDGKMLATGSSMGIVKLWDVATGESIADFRAHNAFVLGLYDTFVSLAFSPDGKTLVSNNSSTIKFWDVASLLADGPARRLKTDRTK